MAPSQKAVENAHNVYAAGWALQLMAMFMWWNASPMGGGVGCGSSFYYSHWTPCYDPYYPGYWYTRQYWNNYLVHSLFFAGATVVRVMDYMDFTWDAITTRGQDQTDGFIQFKSQRYPNSPGTFTPLRYQIFSNADSHTGSTASPQVRNRLVDALLEMGVADITQ